MYNKNDLVYIGLIVTFHINPCIYVITHFHNILGYIIKIYLLIMCNQYTQHYHFLYTTLICHIKIKVEQGLICKDKAENRDRNGRINVGRQPILEGRRS